MQVVFVHGVNNRDAVDGAYAQDVAARTDRLARLAFGGAATIRNPYWGKFGRAERTLESVPRARGGAQTLGLEPSSSSSVGAVFDPAGLDLREIVGTLSIGALQEATKLRHEGERHEVEDYWMAAADFAEMRPRPSWLTQSSTLEEIAATPSCSSLDEKPADPSDARLQLASWMQPGAPRLHASPSSS